VIGSRTTGVLNRDQVIAYIGQNAPLVGVDPAAMLSIANHEGLNTDPGSFWTVPGELFNSFGPPSWNANPRAAGGPIVSKQGSVASAASWAWTPAGLDYWIQQVAGVASGLTGTAAISSIVHNFERPREDLAIGEIRNATRDYAGFQSLIEGVGNGLQPLDGNSGMQGSTGGQVNLGLQSSDPGGITGSGKPTGMNLDFNGTMQHTITQFLLVALAIALLVGGIYLLGGSKR
jgi:hypothetical protein